jgi:hypothetical protein
VNTIIRPSNWKILIRVSATTALLFGFLLASAPRAAAQGGPEIFDPGDMPYGQSYTQWAEDWHKWTLSIPKERNPLLMTAGGWLEPPLVPDYDCVNDQTGDVWFLSGVLAGGTYTFDCTIPEDKALLFPVINTVSIPFTGDTARVSAGEKAGGMPIFLADDLPTAWAEIDGDAVSDLDDWMVDPPIFLETLSDGNWVDVILPLFGESTWIDPPDHPAPQLSGPHYSYGVYLMVAPLDPGSHTIQFGGYDGGLDITYELTVEGDIPPAQCITDLSTTEGIDALVQAQLANLANYVNSQLEAAESAPPAQAAYIRNAVRSLLNTWINQWIPLYVAQGRIPAALEAQAIDCFESVRDSIP